MASQFSLPQYLRVILEVAGYTTQLSLKQALKRCHKELKETFQEFGEYILSDNFEHEEIKENFRIECSNCYISTTKFRLPPGHVDFLIGIIQEMPVEYTLPIQSMPALHQSNTPSKQKRKSQLSEEIGHIPQSFSVPDQQYFLNEPKMKKFKSDDEEFVEYETDGFESVSMQGIKKNTASIIEEDESYFTDINKRRLTNLIRKCWPPEIEHPDELVFEEVNKKSWSVQCSICDGFLKVFLNTNGGYLRFNKANFQRHLQTHVKQICATSNVNIDEQDVVYEEV